MYKNSPWKVLRTWRVTIQNKKPNLLFALTNQFVHQMISTMTKINNNAWQDKEKNQLFALTNQFVHGMISTMTMDQQQQVRINNNRYDNSWWSYFCRYLYWNFFVSIDYCSSRFNAKRRRFLRFESLKKDFSLKSYGYFNAVSCV